MRQIRAKLVLVLLAALTSFAARAAASLDIPAVMDSAAKVFMEDPLFVGVSIGILQNDRQWTADFGSTTRSGIHRPTARTLYPIGSITKTFTGSLLAFAAIEGKLSLEDDVRKYLHGEFQNLEFDGHPVQLRHLLNHRSGLPFLLPDRPELTPGYKGEPIQQFVQRLDHVLNVYTREDFLTDLRAVRLDSAPGEEFRYSNAAAQLAGFVLENIEGTSFERLLARKLARRLGMRDTAITLTTAQRGRLASGYEEGVLMPPPSNALQGAGAIKATLADMLKYLRWHLQEKAPASVLSHRPTFRQGNYAAGLNWQILESDGRRLIWQEGNLPGYTSYLLFQPELNIGIVVLTNESGRSSSRRIAAMANTFLETLDERSIRLP
jgi:D-alanyl-D-alanine-carboxypeptidase/D-alanyl-D-alanine-endopeptidase